MGYRRIFLVFTLAIIFIVALAACGGSKKAPTATPTPTESPKDLLDAAGQQFAAVKSAHYSLKIDGDVYLDSQQTLSLRGAEGDLLRPKSATAKADIGFGGATVSVDMVAIGDDQYITNFLTGNWERAPKGLNYNPAIVFDEENGIQGVVRKAQQVSLVGDEEVDGTAAQHLRGTVARAAVQPMTGNAFKGDPIDFDIWIARDTRDIMKIVLHDTASDQGATPATWTLLISKLNSPVTISAPQT